MTDIKRMFTNQSSNEALRQTASAHEEKTEHTFHFTTSIAITRPQQTQTLLWPQGSKSPPCNIGPSLHSLQSWF